MTDEMFALEENQTFILVRPASSKSIVDCLSVRLLASPLKAHLVAKGYTQIYGF